MTEERSWTSDGLRDYLVGTTQRLELIKQRLRVNDARLRSLETGTSVMSVEWEDSRRRADQLIAAVIATEVGFRAYDMPGLEGRSPQEPLAAMPEFTQSDLDSIAARGESSQFGAVNMIQGYLGEERALNAINSGAVPVPEGRYAALAETSNQPGYDLRLLSEDGSPEMLAQVKISDSSAIIREHFERYPDVSIVYTNSEAARGMIGNPGVTVLSPEDVFPDEPGRYVVDLGLSKDEIRTSAVDMVNGSDGVSFGDQLQEGFPIIALLAIAGRAAYEYLDSDIRASDILRMARRRIMQSMLASGASTAMTIASGEPLLGTAAGLGTLFGSRAVSKAREDVRYATYRLHRMGETLRRIHGLGSGATTTI